MSECALTLWEDEKYLHVPEELFDLLPAEYRAALEERKEQGTDAIQKVGKELNGLLRLCSTIQTVASLRYMYDRLRATTFEITTEGALEQDMLTTAFVVTYARLFGKRGGGAGISSGEIPAHLRNVHDALLDVRHKRYAHDGGHDSVETGIRIDFDEAGFELQLQMRFGFYVGGRNEWQDLLIFLDEHMYERVQKTLRRLKEKTGYDWKFPDGPAPQWVTDQNNQGES
ncbi:hypothetical protein BVER_02736 [Candidatus Burkholderia verschuerenii]|uniref:Uncharacterized protein n=1 Tax=Candidatus Burkholderia verschuerenii TaxID=242163 RepID=A0A0L0M4Z8_9BURK|nr:hypothetical protein [Candidatus Burkholderia verschuerenii]KND57355.1 hypothetical protein BVER_02736 [Candidatus Burkholderia verschuerenii]